MMIKSTSSYVQLAVAEFGVVVVFSLALMLAGCGDQATTDSRPSGPADETHLSDSVREGLAWQQAALPLDAGDGRDVRRYFRLRQEIRYPATRTVARDSIWALWDGDPSHFLWTEVASLYAQYFDDTERLDAAFIRAAGQDTTSAVYRYVQARRHWGRTPALRDRLIEAEARASELSLLEQAWLQSRLALVSFNHRDPTTARDRLLGSLDLAWRAGGWPLAACWWRDIGRYSLFMESLDDALAAGREGVRCAEAAGDSILAIRSHLVVAKSHELRGMYETAAAAYGRCARTADRLGYVRWTQDSLRYQALAASGSSNNRLAIECFERSHRHAVAHADTYSAGVSLLGQAVSYLRLGVLDSARACIARAEFYDDLVAMPNLNSRVATVQLDLLYEIGDYAAADSLLELVGNTQRGSLRQILLINMIDRGLRTGRPDLVYRGLAELRGDPTLLDRQRYYDPKLDVLLLSARFLARQGEFQLAAADLAEAATRLEDGATPVEEWKYTNTTARVAELAGDLVTATAKYEEGLARIESLDEPLLVARARMGLGRTLMSEGRFAAARQLFRAPSQAPEYWNRLSATLMLGMVELADGRPREALVRLQEAERVVGSDGPTGLQAQLRLLTGRCLAALGRPDDALAELRRVEPELGPTVTTSELEIRHAFDRPLSRDLAEAKISLLHDHPRLADSNGAALSALVEAEAVRWRLDPSGAEPTVDALAEIPMRAGAPLVAFFVGRERVFTWVGSVDGWTMHEIPDRERVLRLVDAVQTDMEAPDRTVRWHDARELAALLLDPVVPVWQRGEPLGLVTTGPLAALPWPALPLDDAIDATGELVLDRGPVVHLASLMPTTDYRASSPRGDLLALGVDTPDDDSQLDRAEAEATAVAATWQNGEATLLTGEAANWAALRGRDLSRYGTIHVASHATVSQGLPGCSTLRLAGSHREEPITIYEARSLPLAADLVYLSCCEGARLGGDTGTGLDSFTRAFLQAGARSVVASTQRVDDDAAQAIAQKFYDHWHAGTSRAESLRTAQQAVRSGRREWQHPYYWAYLQIHLADTGSG